MKAWALVCAVLLLAVSLLATLARPAAAAVTLATGEPAR